MKLLQLILSVSSINLTLGLRARCMLDITQPDSKPEGVNPISVMNTNVLSAAQEAKAKDYPELYFEQSINHVDGEIFSQRYFFTDEYYQPGGPAFVYIGGEGELNDRALKSGQVQVLAQKFQASIYSLEHRYYGASQPFTDLSTTNLQYLNSQLAIKDLIRFIQNKRKPNQKFIVVGGSYAGNLAAWSRKLYPDVIHGAIASSAPILALDNFYQYDQLVSRSLGTTCSTKMNQVIQLIDQKLDGNDLAVKGLFDCSDVEDTNFVSVLADVVATAVQYNRVGISFNINRVCQDFENLQLEEAILHLANTTKFYFKTQGKTCMQLTGLQDIQNLSVVKNSGTRQWTYQTCQEFGYWQTVPPPPYPSTRSQRLTLDWVYNTSCSPINFSQIQGPPNVQQTNSYYGGLDNLKEKTVFINGGLDPWSALSVTRDPGVQGVEVIFIPSGSHTQDLLADNKNDPNDLRQARLRVVQIVQGWLQ